LAIVLSTQHATENGEQKQILSWHGPWKIEAGSVHSVKMPLKAEK